jgi:predicted HD phosphohydrolase
MLTKILSLFETRGAEAYLGEPVSQLEHALQAAHLASRDGASSALVAAALLHDIGHLLGPDGNAAGGWNVTGVTLAQAGKWLIPISPAVSPIRLARSRPPGP